MEIQEFPKALYRDGAYKEVKDEAEEAIATDDGFTDWQTDNARINGAADTSQGEQPAELSHADMKAKATEMGLTFHHNISKAKLAELIANGKAE